jgi:AcrR family transcriptional regulator
MFQMVHHRCTKWYTHQVERSPAAQELLDRAIDYVAANGLTDLSLRSLAGELGTSHRMLSHHFGSKEGVWVAIIQEVERRQLAHVDQQIADRSMSGADALRSYWQHISDPSMWPNERLFFEVYGQALHRRPGTEHLLEGIVASWLEPMTAAGLDRATARLHLAVIRGLLLDLLATEDRTGVDDAMERWISLSVRARGRTPTRS